MRARPDREKISSTDAHEGQAPRPATKGGSSIHTQPPRWQPTSPFDKAFADFPRDLVRCQFHDSFEYSGNWSNELPAKFKEMHGYDLNDHAKELWGKGDADTNGRVLSDYRETLGQMHLDYLKVWVKWSHDHGMLTRNQAHGAPGNLLDLYAVADVS